MDIDLTSETQQNYEESNLFNITFGLVPFFMLYLGWVLAKKIFLTIFRFRVPYHVKGYDVLGFRLAV